MHVQNELDFVVDIEINESEDDNSQNEFLNSIDMQEVNKELLEQQKVHAGSGYYESLQNDSVHNSQIELMFLLKKARTPIYLFDQIIKWAKNAAQYNNVDFMTIGNISRHNCLNNLRNQYDLDGLQPKKIDVLLRGTQSQMQLTVHSFKQCLYSILNDSNIMNENNLLFNKETMFHSSSRLKRSTISDINSGSVYQKAQTVYLTPNSNEVLCPIIFFIDKTHTDINGRLCLEQIRFTLGIFN